MREIELIAPGIICKVSDVGLACSVVSDIIDNIWYTSERHKDVLTIHFEGKTLAEVYIKSKLLNINCRGASNQYPLPYGKDAVQEIIAETLS